MKVASITGPRQAALIDLPDPTPGEDYMSYGSYGSYGSYVILPLIPRP